MSPIIAKALWLIFNPANIFVGLVVLSAVLLFTRWRQSGRLLVGLLAICTLIVSYFPLEDWIFEPLQTRFAVPERMPEKVAGIVVLGGGIDTRQSNRIGRVTLNSRAERITAFVELARRYPEAKLVYSGGAGNEPISEAEVAKPLLVGLGIPAERLILESKSRDTYENALFTRALVQPSPSEIWVVITSASHMPRAIGTFRQLRWNVIPYPVDHRRLGEGDETFGRNFPRGLNLLNAALREWVSLAHYYLSGRIAQFFPAP